MWQNYIGFSMLSFSSTARILYWKLHCYGNYNFKNLVQWKPSLFLWNFKIIENYLFWKLVLQKSKWLKHLILWILNAKVHNLLGVLHELNFQENYCLFLFFFFLSSTIFLLVSVFWKCDQVSLVALKKVPLGESSVTSGSVITIKKWLLTP